MKTVLSVLVAVTLVFGGAALMADEVKDLSQNHGGPGWAAPSPRGNVDPIALGSTTIGYDTGTVTAQSVSPGSRAFGNVFDSHLGNPLGMGNSVTQVTVFLAGLAGGAVFATAFDQLNTGAGTANSINDFLWSSAETPLVVNALNTWSIANAGEGPLNFVGDSVLFGLWNTAQDVGTDEDAVGLDSSGTTMGQGFHGMQIDFGGGAFSFMPGVNSIVRVTGPGLPVELMSFSVDGE